MRLRNLLLICASCLILLTCGDDHHHPTQTIIEHSHCRHAGCPFYDNSDSLSTHKLELCDSTAHYSRGHHGPRCKKRCEGGK